MRIIRDIDVSPFMEREIICDSQRRMMHPERWRDMKVDLFVDFELFLDEFRYHASLRRDPKSYHRDTPFHAYMAGGLIHLLLGTVNTPGADYSTLELTLRQRESNKVCILYAHGNNREGTWQIYDSESTSYVSAQFINWYFADLNVGESPEFMKVPQPLLAQSAVDILSGLPGPQNKYAVLLLLSCNPDGQHDVLARDTPLFYAKGKIGRSYYFQPIFAPATVSGTD